MKTKEKLLCLYSIICIASTVNIVTGIKDANDLRIEGDSYGVFKCVNNIFLNIGMLPLFIYFARLIMRSEDQAEKEAKEEQEQKTNRFIEAKQFKVVEIQNNQVSISGMNSNNFFSFTQNKSHENLTKISASPSTSPIFE